MASRDVFELPEDDIDIEVVEEKPTKKKRQLTQTQKEVLKERLKKAREAKKAKAQKKKEEPDAVKPKAEVFDTGVKVEAGKSSNEYNDDIKTLRDELKNLRRENEKMRHKMEMDELKNQIKELQGLMRNAKKEEKIEAKQEEKKPDIKVKEDQQDVEPKQETVVARPPPSKPQPPQPVVFSMLKNNWY